MSLGPDSLAIDYAGHLDGRTQSNPSNDRPRYDEYLVSRLREAFDRDADARLPYEFDWELYRLYLKGEQLVVRNRYTNELVVLSEDDTKRLFSINNQLRPTARAFVAKLARNIPTCKVFPSSADWEEQHGAQVANAFIDQARRKENLDLKYIEAIDYLPWAGNSILQLRWNPDKGRELLFCDVCEYTEEIDDDLDETDVCPQCQAQREQELAMQQQQHIAQQEAGMAQVAQELSLAMGMPVLPTPDMVPEEALEPPPLQSVGPLQPDQEPPLMQIVKEGDYDVVVHDIRDIFFDAAASCLEECGHVTVRKPMSVSKIREMFPAFTSEVTPDDEIHTSANGRFQGGWGENHREAQYLTDHAYLYETHEAPTPNYKYGRIIWWLSNGIILKEMKSPYFRLFNRFPFYQLVADRNQGEIYAEPPIKQAWHRQRELNENESHIRSHITLLLKPKWLVPIGSRISEDEITATSAQIIKANLNAGDPRIMAAPPVPSDVFQRNAFLFNNIQSQFSVTEQELGISQADPNARAAAILDAEASQQIGPMLRRINSEWSQMHRDILRLIQEFYSDERTATVVGDEGYQTYSFRDLNLRPGWDVIVEESDSLSQNRALRLQQAMDLAQMGRFVDPSTGMPNWKEFDRMAQINTHKAGYDTEATEFAHAQSLPTRLKNGEQPMPQQEDDPQIHAEVLLGWIRGPGRKADPQLQQQVRQYWMYYTMWAMSGDMNAAAQATGLGAQPGSEQSSPGGTPNAPASLNARAGQGDVQSEANAAVRAADARTEGLVQDRQQRG